LLSSFLGRSINHVGLKRAIAKVFPGLFDDEPLPDETEEDVR